MIFQKQKRDLDHANHTIGLQNLLVTGLMLLSMALAVSTCSLIGRERIILVPPTISKSFWIDKAKVSGDYLDQMALFLIQLILNVSPRSVDFQSKILLQYAAPEAYAELKAMMMTTSELEDEELVKLLSDNAPRIDLILSDAGSEAEDDDGDGKKTTLYDTRNAPARKALRKLAKQPSTFTMQDRLFNGTGHIGHNKFVVYVNDAGVAKSVLTGSTNWTWSGVAGQSNNCIRIDNDDVAAAYLAYWKSLHKDKQPKPKPLSARNTGAGQSDELKESDQTATVVDLGGGATIEVWLSPNVPGKNQPPSPTAKEKLPPPPDMNRLFSLMRKARRSIFFLVFMPSRGGVNSIVSEAVALGQKDSSLEVIGAISDTQAMWGYKPGSKDDTTGKKVPASSPHVFEQGGVSVVRATALTDREIGRPLGDFQFDEKLTVGRAIIHDKILVLDPTDPVNCTVAFGSHNLGYKASYSNDENLVIVRGHRPLALAYAAHVLDVFDHYRFRAVEAELAKKKGSSVAAKKFDGFLDRTDGWQGSASRRLSRYFTESKL